jgi:hypothetical protein
MQGADLRMAKIWLTTSTKTNLELARIELEATNLVDPLFDANLLQRNKNAAVAIEDWLAELPINKFKKRARRRLAALAKPVGASSDWSPWIDAENLNGLKLWNEKAQRELGVLLSQLGCETNSAPHIARGILRRIKDADEQFFRSFMATALLDPTCAGAKGLTNEELAQLRNIRDGKEP